MVPESTFGRCADSLARVKPGRPFCTTQRKPFKPSHACPKRQAWHPKAVLYLTQNMPPCRPPRCQNRYDACPLGCLSSICVRNSGACSRTNIKALRETDCFIVFKIAEIESCRVRLAAPNVIAKHVTQRGRLTPETNCVNQNGASRRTLQFYETLPVRLRRSTSCGFDRLQRRWSSFR
jgi:hypothetical protein